MNATALNYINILLLLILFACKNDADPYAGQSAGNTI